MKANKIELQKLRKAKKKESLFLLSFSGIELNSFFRANKDLYANLKKSSDFKEPFRLK